MAEAGVESLCQTGREGRCELQVPLRPEHRAVAHVRGEERELGVEVRSLTEPVLESVNSKGVTYLVEAGPPAPPFVADAARA